MNETPLLCATNLNHVHLVKSLFDGGADVNLMGFFMTSCLCGPDCDCISSRDKQCRSVEHDKFATLVIFGSETYLGGISATGAQFDLQSPKMIEPEWVPNQY